MIKIFKKIWNDSKANHKSLVSALILSFLRSSFAVTQILALMITIKCLVSGIVDNNKIIGIVILTLICVIGNYMTSYFEQINTLKSGFYMVRDKRIKVADKLRKLPLGYFNNDSRSNTITTLTTTLTGVESGSTMVMVGIISGLFNSIAFFIFMMIYEYRIGLIMLLGIICYLVLVNYQMKLSRKNAPILTDAQNNLSNKTLTFLEGIKVIKTYSYNDGDKDLKAAINKSMEENINLTKKSMPTQYLGSLIISLFESLILLATTIFYFKTGDFDLIKTILLIIFSFMAYASLNQAGSMLSMIGLLDSGLSEVEKIEEIEELKVSDNPVIVNGNDISFNNVSFKYGDNEVLHNISFKVKENSLTAIVGKSGSGKSTICKLVPRFMDINSGEITIGNEDIRNMKYEDLSKKISMVFQRVYLFEDTILNNIKFGKLDATMDEVIEACKKARCHEFISKLKEGYDTVLTEGGNNLSGGEKQRISIARAILKDSPIIILDEATASIDADNEIEVIKAMNELTKNKTVIMIAHKLKTIKRADNIICIDNGRIVDQGVHEDLIKHDGIYKKFIDSRIKAKEFMIKR